MEPEFRHGHFAHPELLDFAGHGGGELVHELPVGWNLEGRNPDSAKCGEFFTAHVPSGSSFHPRHHFFAVLRARDADDLDVQDGGVRVQVFLDLARIHVLAAADNHVLDAAYDVDVTIRVGGRQIAGVHPARLVNRFARRFLVAPVTKHHAVPARAAVSY